MGKIVRFFVTTIFTALAFQEGGGGRGGGVQKAMQCIQGNVRLLDHTYTTFEVIANKKEWTVRLFALTNSL